MTTAEVRRVVRAAGRAPSVHNSQPWLFDWDGRHLDLRADWTRHLPVLDPVGRQLSMSCGAALALSVVGMRAAGRDPQPQLFPDDRPGGPLVRLDTRTPLAACGVTRARELFSAIGARRMVRGSFAARRVPASLLCCLAGIAATESAVASPVLGPQPRRAVAHLIDVSDATERADPACRWELHEWLHDHPDHRADGVMPAPADTGARTFPNRYRPDRQADPRPSSDHHPLPGFDHSPGQHPPGTAEGTPAPDLLILSTAGDGPGDWLAAGRALATILLVTTRLGLGAMLLNQPVDAEDTRRELARAAGVTGHPQALLAIGYPAGRPGAPTPRRHIDTFFTNRSEPFSHPADPEPHR
ncbi:nitroreductase family protein [Frankia sp. AgB32]|uniref:Acg family FMN-binding oxidoreductase n=1 Tax=Frankia sp. AgB32 TaxID=631119 RepID=UPI00200E1C0D|nr:nitroreductase family protein [Frankia sp. AgB32]MCK9893958.1 nitroreductase family protein [Frankia sp. AgB32]